MKALRLTSCCCGGILLLFASPLPARECPRLTVLLHPGSIPSKRCAADVGVISGAIKYIEEDFGLSTLQKARVKVQSEKERRESID